MVGQPSPVDINDFTFFLIVVFLVYERMSDEPWSICSNYRDNYRTLCPLFWDGKGLHEDGDSYVIYWCVGFLLRTHSGKQKVGNR